MAMENTSRLQFSESDINIAAYLLTRGYRFLRCEDAGQGRLAFVFSDPNGTAANDVEEYFRGGQCEARQALESLRKLKDALYSAKNRRNGNGDSHRYPTFQI